MPVIRHFWLEMAGRNPEDIWAQRKSSADGIPLSALLCFEDLESVPRNCTVYEVARTRVEYIPSHQLLRKADRSVPVPTMPAHLVAAQTGPVAGRR